MPSGELTVVTLNTRGIPLAGSHLAERLVAIGARLDAGDADVVCLQEVVTWWHLRLLAGHMRSFRHVAYQRSAAGPAGGLVTFSRRTVSGREYRRFGVPPGGPGITRTMRLRGALKGALVTRLREPELTVVSTHPLSNWDGDWTPANRFYPQHRAQLGALTAVLRGVDGPAVACGDFNVAGDSELMREFMADNRLCDVFDGACPPTFRAEYLPAGAMPHCIDFILTTCDVKTVTASPVLTEQVALSRGPAWLSDHIGLSATLHL